MKNQSPTKAVIYCRVSSAKQVSEGNGLQSQETRCREYAGYKNYEVIDVFQDEGVSGGLIDRPSMQAMLKFLRTASRNGQVAVIIDDISRLARGLDAHIQLRGAIGSVGGKLESPSIEFGDDSDSILVENLLASVSQHGRQKNAEQVVNRMQARVMNGYWCFGPPFGYTYKSVKGHGKLLVRDEPIASIVQTALEGFASGRFGSQSEVRRYLESQAAFPKDDHGEVRFRRVEDILNQPLYAGYMNVSKWDVQMHEGKHEPLIDLSVYKKNQALRKSNSNVPARIDINEDFPLRGYIRCGTCGHTMSAGWSKGRNAKYPYYFCQSRTCKHKRKSIRAEKIEEEFESLLQNMTPTRDLFIMTFMMFEELWANQDVIVENQIKVEKSNFSKFDKKLNQIMDRLIETDSPTMIQAYENQVKKLEIKKLEIQENIQKCGRPASDFKGTYRTAMEFLANPCNLWNSNELADKRLAVKLTFGSNLHYVRNEGYRTAKSTLPFKALVSLSSGKKDLVDLDGETLNSVIDVFKDWDYQLKRADLSEVDFKETSK